MHGTCIEIIGQQVFLYQVIYMTTMMMMMVVLGVMVFVLVSVQFP